MDETPNPIRHNTSAPPVALPAGHVGPVMLPGTNREIWWTGRVAIGLRYEPPAPREPISRSAAWVQSLMLAWSRRQGQRRSTRTA
ncbi:hypothetical protein [Rubrivivax gelatinosus]|uniref:hypothetical protein n=1 Tax=Rubrivivax gelatinosus TaxID=28068 RepID=UPI001908E3F5|nr:hypothetical protein [Rubrivivax gelatinosus]